jgi:hypothetical protein
MITNGFENGEVRVDLVQEMRVLAGQGTDVPALVTLLQQRLALSDQKALFPTLAYFRAAFCLSLREALPLREWLSGRDRSEVDSILIPAINRTKNQWQAAGALQRT